MRIRKAVQVALLVTVFGGGYVCGTTTQRTADAQFKELGEAAAQKAAGSGGAVGSVMELGSAILEMQQHVDGLQKNIDVLKKVKSAIGG